MKKLLAILLVLALLLPMGTVAHAEEVETKPFYMVNWSTFESELTNVYPMPYFWSDKNSVAEGEMPYLSWSGTSDIAEIAELLRERFDEYPEGARHINFCLVHDALRQLAEDACILDKGIPVVQMWLEKFLEEYKRIGGKLDGLVIDLEYFSVSYYYIHSNYYTSDPLIYDKIVKNPVYQEKIRPQLVERGFQFFPNPNEHTPEIYSIHPSSGDQYAQSRSIWDAVMRSYANQCITEACSSVWEYYPDAVVSDYQSKSIKPWLKELNDSGGVITNGGNYVTAGNSSNENFYSVRPYTSFYTSTNGPVYRTIPGYNNAIYDESPFSMLMYDANLAKTTYLASDNSSVSWWISHYIYNIKTESSASNTPYYAETLFHLGMLDPEIYLGYILQGEVADITGGDTEPYEIGLQIIDDVMKELTRVVGYADRKPICVANEWNSQFVLSGMYAGGKNYWRLTPDTTKVSLADFKVEGTDPTFSVGGETITFPQGKIVADGSVREIGTCGYWIETPADVTPVVTRAANYFREYPAFAETFEAYEAGTEYNYSNALPATCWEVKKQGGGSGTVVADGDGKALAVKGTYTAKNVKMPVNITAGDTYAENQAWEISFTLPSDMAADAELVLLNAASEKKVSKDGGIKIAGGKVYYSQAGEYVELAGVEIAAGAKYTVVRDVDFSVEDAFTSDYYVYGADGSLLGKAMDIPMAEIALPVYSISIGCTKVAGEAVILDDYKLYPTKVAADFYLYDANTGMQVTETDKAREGNIAYRLSWLNATEKEKTYSVVAAYYNGETLAEEKVISEVKMAPNADGILTGIVENKTEGQTVKVYLRDDNPAENGGDDTNGSDDDHGSAGLNSMQIIIIAATAAVVVIAVTVIVVVVSSKKKKKTEAAPENEETTNE